MGELPFPYNVYGTGQYNFMGNPEQNPVVQIIKEYKLNHEPANINAMTGIFEDELPLETNFGTANTINDRLVNYNYLRTIFFPSGDGDDVNLSGTKKNSLLRRMKFTLVNPYKPLDAEKSPYDGLPKDFALYWTCYPIRHERGQIICAKNSININARIHKYDMENGKPYVDNEKRFYSEMYEHVIKDKKCPHFTMMYGYYKAKDTGLDFNELRKLTSRKQIKRRVKNSDCFVMLTESPTYNIEKWYSNTSTGNGSVMKTSTIGYHPDIEWESIIFQILIGIYTLCKMKINITNFSEKNIFIKDTYQPELAFWKYVVNGCEYYVPNCGYLVMIEPIPPNDASEDTIKFDDEKFDGYNNFLTKYLSVSTFKSGAASKSSIVSPSNKIIKLIEKFNTTFNTLSRPSSKFHEKLLGSIIDIFRFYLHKKIGDTLTELEKTNIKDIYGIYDGSVGKMAVYNVAFDTYKFVWVINENKKDDEFNIMTGDIDSDGKKKYSSIKVSRATLRNYIDAEKIPQRDKEWDEKTTLNVLETYKLDKIGL